MGTRLGLEHGQLASVDALDKTLYGRITTEKHTPRLARPPSPVATGEGQGVGD